MKFLKMLADFLQFYKINKSVKFSYFPEKLNNYFFYCKVTIVFSQMLSLVNKKIKFMLKLFSLKQSFKTTAVSIIKGPESDFLFPES